MKPHTDIARELTASPAGSSPQERAEFSYEDAARIAVDEGKAINQVQDEFRRRQAPILPLQKALAAEAGLEAQCSRAGAKVAEALDLQGQWEALQRRRAGVLAKIARGTEALIECTAICQAGREGWEMWTDFEQTSPGQFAAVRAGISELLTYERLVADLPAWIERRRAELVTMDADIAGFEKEHGIKAR